MGMNRQAGFTANIIGFGNTVWLQFFSLSRQKQQQTELPSKSDPSQKVSSNMHQGSRRQVDASLYIASQHHFKIKPLRPCSKLNNVTKISTSPNTCTVSTDIWLLPLKESVVLTKWPSADWAGSVGAFKSCHNWNTCHGFWNEFSPQDVQCALLNHGPCPLLSLPTASEITD